MKNLDSDSFLLQIPPTKSTCNNSLLLRSHRSCSYDLFKIACAAIERVDR